MDDKIKLAGTWKWSDVWPRLQKDSVQWGKTWVVPYATDTRAFFYNKTLMQKAGLDPNKPPTTWAQLRADARQITQRTGKPGYVEMAKDDNTAGWILTTVVYSLGGRMEKGTGTKAVAVFSMAEPSAPGQPGPRKR